MYKQIKYTIFETDWGYFGLAGTEATLYRTHLPATNPEKLKSRLIRNLSHAKHDKFIFKHLQKQIIDYFKGNCANFKQNIPIALDGLSPFAVSVLSICRKITYGHTITYGQLAKMARSPGVARAVGNALAKNPLPLIIPCHRVIRKDGNIGGFTAPGGKKVKKRLLQHEQKTFSHPKF